MWVEGQTGGRMDGHNEANGLDVLLAVHLSIILATD